MPVAALVSATAVMRPMPSAPVAITELGSTSSGTRDKSSIAPDKNASIHRASSSGPGNSASLNGDDGACDANTNATCTTANSTKQPIASFSSESFAGAFTREDSHRIGYISRAMLDLKYVVENLDEVRRELGRRGPAAAEKLTEVSQLSQSRRETITRLETLRAQKNQASADMAKIADKKGAEFAAKREELRVVGDETKALEAKQKEVESALEGLLLHIPNILDASVPAGSTDGDNEEIRRWGTKPTLDFQPKDHADLGTALGILDFDRGAKLSGARFTVLAGMGARLERALINFMVDMHAEQHGYTEMWTPVIVKRQALIGTTQLPKFAEDVFKLESFGAGSGTEADAAANERYLIPTAEVSITNLHSDEILEGAELPISYTGYTACFRSEAGSYGKDTKGLIRQHQFDKVELVKFTRPEDAEAEHEALTSHAENVLKALGLHYRVMRLCSGDVGFASKKTYDLEVWLPGQDAFREISSCSWFGDFQARRANIRFRPAPGEKPQFVHTLNGSGLAVGRTLVAILEQYQQADGSVRVPDALVPYMRGVTVIR